MKGPASSEPSAFPKCRFPGQFISVDGSSGHIWQIDIAFSRHAVPAKHRVDSLCKLGAIPFVDTTSVYPKVLQAVTSSLFSAELYLAVASLTLARAIYQVFEKLPSYGNFSPFLFSFTSLNIPFALSLALHR